MINETLIRLYKDYYGDKFDDIIQCGIVDEETYLSVYPKIVFLLREPHTEETGWSIPSGLSRNVEKGLKGEPLEKGYMYTWRQAGVWAYSIIHGFDNYSVLKSDIHVAKGLQAIGMTNLKKTGGGASSNLREISYYARNEKDLWQRELEIMNPNLVICGSTYQDVQKNLGLDEHDLAKIDGKPYSYSVYGASQGQRVIIDFWHPGIRGNRDHILNHLRILIDRLKGKGLF
jgi:hypothetical protein